MENKNKMLELKKKQAVKCLEKIGVNSDMIEKFKESEKNLVVSDSDGYIQELDSKHVKALDFFKKRSKALPYFVLENSGISIFFVSEIEEWMNLEEIEEQWDMDLEDIGTGYSLVYVFNEYDEELSEFGGVYFEPSVYGGQIRVG
jgi:hypothetical protein